MAINVMMPDDIRTHETKILGPFTKRDLICLTIGLAYTVPITLLVPASLENKFLIFLLCCMPAFLSAKVKIKGLAFEIFVAKYLYLNFLTPKKRKYKTYNKYRAWLEADKKRTINKMPKAQREAYQKKTLITSSKYPIYK